MIQLKTKEYRKFPKKYTSITHCTVLLLLGGRRHETWAGGVMELSAAPSRYYEHYSYTNMVITETKPAQNKSIS